MKKSKAFFWNHKEEEIILFWESLFSVANKFGRVFAKIDSKSDPFDTITINKNMTESVVLMHSNFL